MFWQQDISFWTGNMYLLLNQKTTQETEITSGLPASNKAIVFQISFLDKQIILYNCPNELLKIFWSLIE